MILLYHEVVATGILSSTSNCVVDRIHKTLTKYYSYVMIQFRSHEQNLKYGKFKKRGSRKEKRNRIVHYNFSETEKCNMISTLALYADRVVAFI